MIIIAKIKPKKTVRELKNFTIGKGNAKASFKNVKKIKSGSIPVYYSVDVYGKKGLKNKELLIMSENKKELDKVLVKMYPYVVRKDLM